MSDMKMGPASPRPAGRTVSRFERAAKVEAPSWWPQPTPPTEAHTISEQMVADLAKLQTFSARYSPGDLFSPAKPVSDAVLARLRAVAELVAAARQEAERPPRKIRGG
jgi:hypothetical protein